MMTPEIVELQPTVEMLAGVTPNDVEDFVRLLPQLTSKGLDAEQVEANLQVATDPENGNTCIIVIRHPETHRIISTATGGICRIPTGEKAWIDDVITDDAYRGQGHGRKVMDSLHEWFASRGVSSVNLTSTPSRAAAGNLYKSMGYDERNTRVYRKSLGEAAIAGIAE